STPSASDTTLAARIARLSLPAGTRHRSVDHVLHRDAWRQAALAGARWVDVGGRGPPRRGWPAAAPRQPPRTRTRAVDLPGQEPAGCTARAHRSGLGGGRRVVRDSAGPLPRLAGSRRPAPRHLPACQAIDGPALRRAVRHIVARLNNPGVGPVRYVLRGLTCRRDDIDSRASTSS